MNIIIMLNCIKQKSVKEYGFTKWNEFSDQTNICNYTQDFMKSWLLNK